VRSETHELQDAIAGFAIDQHQVWTEVTISMIRPVADQGLVVVLWSQYAIGSEHRDDGCEGLIKADAPLPAGFAL
jgi:hypothetical protein